MFLWSDNLLTIILRKKKTFHFTLETVFEHQGYWLFLDKEVLVSPLEKMGEKCLLLSSQYCLYKEI